MVGCRGPARNPSSRVKLPCCFKHCSSGLDVKNVGKELRIPITKLSVSMCRPMKHNSKIGRFCCKKHLQKCLLKRRSTDNANKRGAREVLDCKEVGYFLAFAVHMHLPWLAVLSLLQIQVGERADCIRQCRPRLRQAESRYLLHMR